MHAARVRRPAMRIGRVLGIVTTLASCSLHDDEPTMASRADCEELRRIEAKLVVAAASPAKAAPRIRAELDRHALNLAGVGGEVALQRCTTERTIASIDCARRATALDELDRCRGL
jgi:hypothetical protein